MRVIHWTTPLDEFSKKASHLDRFHFVHFVLSIVKFKDFVKLSPNLFWILVYENLLNQWVGNLVQDRFGGFFLLDEYCVVCSWNEGVQNEDCQFLAIGSQYRRPGRRIRPPIKKRDFANKTVAELCPQNQVQNVTQEFDGSIGGLAAEHETAELMKRSCFANKVTFCGQ